MPTAIPDPEYLLRGVAGNVFGRTYSLLAPAIVGRAPESDIHLDDQGVSRQHARLRPLEYGVEIEDLGSTNGTFINGQRITGGIAAVGDEVAFDQLRFRVGGRHVPAHTRLHGRVTAPPKATTRRAWIAMAVAAAVAILVVLSVLW